MIKVFSSENCSICTSLTAYLDSRRVKYDIIDVDESRNNYERLIAVSGQTAVPVTVFDNGIIICGFDKQSIDKLIQ